MPVAIERDTLEKVAVAVLRSRSPVRVAKSLVPLPDLTSDCQIVVGFRIESDKLHRIPEILAAGGIFEVAVVFVLTKQGVRGWWGTALRGLSLCNGNEQSQKNQRHQQAGS